MVHVRFSRWILFIGFLWWCAEFGLCAAQVPALSDADLPALLARLKAKRVVNGKLAEQYTSDEFWHNLNFDKSGKTTVDESAKYENVFVEGLPYRKKIEANGKPLAGKAAAAEEGRYEKAVRERRGMTTEQKRMSLHKTWHSSLPDCCLATLFSNHIAGFEQIDGRDAVVVESVPRPDAKPKDDAERSALGWKQKSWIDLTETMFARMEVESLNDTNHMGKGTTTRIDFERVIDSAPDGDQAGQVVWLPRRIVSKGRFKMLWMDIRMTTEQTWTNYKKFHVDMRLLEDTVTQVGEGAGNSEE